MKIMRHILPQIPIENYSVAIREAVSWLGSRRLLAAPINAHPANGAPLRYFTERRNWHARIADKH